MSDQLHPAARLAATDPSDDDLVVVDAARLAYVGFPIAVAVTQAAWADAVTWHAEDSDRHPAAADDAPERLLRLLMHALLAWTDCRGASVVFSLERIRRDGPPNAVSTVRLMITPSATSMGLPLAVIGLLGEH
jgi:hypothetical protein